MLRTRIITAVVLLLVLILAGLISAQTLLGLGAAFFGVALFEWLRLAGMARVGAAGLAMLFAGAAMGLELLGVRAPADVLASLCAGACAAWITIGLLLVRAQRGPVVIARALLVLAALGLAGVAWMALAALLRAGIAWTLSVLAMVWLADIAAYFSGRAFGVHKLASRISPGKTWEGVWGALAAVVVVAEVLRWFWPDAAVWSTRMLVAAPVGGILLLLVLTALSIVGDLFESLVKRQAGVKDSGRLLPGHGGVWDRIDATLPVLPLAVLGNAILAGGWRGG